MAFRSTFESLDRNRANSRDTTSREQAVAKLKSPVALETAFAAYTLDEILGEGGAGRVYGGKSAEGAPVAIKVLTSTSRDKRARFKN